jgi:hypothetical protein
MTTVSDDPTIQNVAFDRIRFFLNEIMQNGILVDSSCPKLNDLLKLSPDRLIVLPEQPFDQVVGMALFCKLNAIMNEEIIIDEVELSSDEGSGIIYHVDESDDMSDFTETSKKKKISPWWNREDLTTFDTKKPPEDFDWGSIGLDWEQNSDDLEIEFDPEAGMNDDEPVVDLSVTPSLKDFNPTVVSGGKEDISPDEEDE